MEHKIDGNFNLHSFGHSFRTTFLPPALKRIHSKKNMLVYLYTSYEKMKEEEMKYLYPNEKLTTDSAGKKVEADLRMRIIARNIEKDVVLSENQVAKEYSVSRSPVREAFKVLEQEGLIRLQRMGAVVIGFNEIDINELYDIRLMIESFVFERALNKDNQELIVTLQKIIEMMKIATKYEDADEFSFRDIEFHEMIVKSIQHQKIFMLWSNIRPIMECLILLSMRHRMETNVKDFERVITNHELMLKSIIKKDKKIAEQSFYQNFNDVLNNHSGFWDEFEKEK